MYRSMYKNVRLLLNLCSRKGLSCRAFRKAERLFCNGVQKVMFAWLGNRANHHLCLLRTTQEQHLPVKASNLSLVTAASEHYHPTVQAAISVPMHSDLWITVNSEVQSLLLFFVVILVQFATPHTAWIRSSMGAQEAFTKILNGEITARKQKENLNPGYPHRRKTLIPVTHTRKRLCFLCMWMLRSSEHGPSLLWKARRTW